MRVFQRPARCHFERQREIFLNSKADYDQAEDVVYGVMPAEAINLVVRLW